MFKRSVLSVAFILSASAAFAAATPAVVESPSDIYARCGVNLSNPNSIVEAVTFHHRPGMQAPEKAGLVTALHAANGLINMCQLEKNVIYNAYLDLNYLQNVTVVERLDEWTLMAQELVQKAN